MITHVSVAVMYVADQQASRRFYVDQLGLEVVRDDEMWPGARWLEVRPRGAQTPHFSSTPARQGGHRMVHQEIPYPEGSFGAK